MTDVLFSSFGLSPSLLQSIEELQYKTASPIQAQALPILLGEPTDFLGLAATGTGKTAAFGIPMLEKIDPQIRAVQALVMCPTRELALQVSEQINLLGKHKRIRSTAVYGGSGYAEQIAAFRSGVNIVVGTPGRLVDHVEQGKLRLDDLKLLVLDEADEMISMGFKEDLEKILKAIPRDAANTWLFSATMSREVSRVADEYLRNPKRIQVNREEMLSATIEQFYFATNESNKPEILCKLIESAEEFYGLVFCQTKALVADLTQYLTERGYRVDCLHGDKDQASRERTMVAFRTRRVNVLVCTDVAARGLDVKDVTHVINYSLPRELDNYVHRIGRTARSGKTGIAFNLVTPAHRRLIVQIERLTKSRMLEGRLPTRRELGAKKVGRQFELFMKQPHHDRAVEVMSDEWKAAIADMTAEEVAGRFLNLMMPDIFNEKETARSTAPAPTAEATKRVLPPIGGARGGGYRPGATSAPSSRPSAPSSRPSFARPDAGLDEDDAPMMDDSTPFGVRSSGDSRPKFSGSTFGHSSASSSNGPVAGPSGGFSPRPSFADRPYAKRTEHAPRESRSFSKPHDREARESRPYSKAARGPGQPTRAVPPYVRAKQAGEQPEMNRKARRALAFGLAQQQMSQLVRDGSTES